MKKPKNGQIARYTDNYTGTDYGLRIRYRGNWYDKRGQLMMPNDDLWYTGEYAPVEMEEA